MSVFFLLPVVVLVVEISALRSMNRNASEILWAGKGERDSAWDHKLRKKDCVFISRVFTSA
jgi:hypothetical protein